MSIQQDHLYRVRQLMFSTSLILVCWLGMMCLHELGHVAGALLTGGSIQKVVLHPLAISRTDVRPNPSPSVVVWAGPLIGSILPLCIWLVCPRIGQIRPVLQFFAGFCLITNGAYIAVGSAEGIGDAGEMLATGTPLWVMLLFGLISGSCGFLLWHRLGSLQTYWRHPEAITQRMMVCMFVMLISILTFELLMSSDQ